MKHAWAATLALALVAAGARGDESPDDFSAAFQADPSALEAGTPAEHEALVAVRAGKWVRARKLAERILEKTPGSYAARYCLGMAMHYGEGDLPRAAVDLEEAARAFEARWGPTPGADAPTFWHSESLKELAYAYDEMNRPEDELRVLDRFDHAYEPARTAQRVWPLMKLRRFEAARATAQRAIKSGMDDQAIIARTGLCATEFEAGDRQAAYRACIDAMKAFERGGGGEMEFSNASEAALGIYKFDEAERYIQESIKRATDEEWGNPYQHLAWLYLDEARLGEAIEALKGAQELRQSRPAWLDQHGQARLDYTVAATLLLSGETERALQLAERAELRPDRVGVWSGTEAQADAGTAVLVAVAHREWAARLEENATTANFYEATRLRLRALGERIAAWHEARRAAVLFADEALLLGTLRPYYVGGADLATWLTPEITAFVGPGVVLRTLEDARNLEKGPTATAYLDALAAEAEWRRHDWSEALELAEKALKDLPRAEGLLSGRLAAVAADAARHLGDDRRAAEHYATVLARDPDVLRRLDLALPVAVETDGSPIAQAASDLIGRSPRFDVVGGPGVHVISLRGGTGGGQLEACLYGPRHEMLQCNTQPPSNKLSPTQQARELVAALHKSAFAAKVDLTQADLSALDGSPTAGRAEHQVKSLLDGMAPDR